MLNSNTQKTLDAIYPVGSIYLSVTLDTADKVAAALGGTWSKFTNDAYLKIVSSGAGSSGGNTDHKITTNQMPSHTHTFTGNAISGGADQALGSWGHDSGASNISTSGPFSVGSKTGEVGSSGSTIKKFRVNFNATPSGSNSSTGGGNAYYPGYIGVYVYQRTA